ncbi:alcohol oxidase [Punctularia strigosozonata HHB-11173 SS5]|uniref:alcohol oxidase n=1 Tax=Punctularia strigosozonata (strain HHB-11173) TaxID=741275 RepID=UPI0004416378|nr:alcohol oxidase [Punctularia strigosozonata HHB-11173 SS5]EIN07763.1 alcohol oxidase [Punctularia strigosozonata HHB-11173 SS5]
MMFALSARASKVLRLASAVALALAIVLRYRRRNGRARFLVKDLGKAGSKVAHDASPDEAVGPLYDVVIIGGGTAGCVLASRLSEDPSVSVLLLEAGGSGLDVPFSRIPMAYSRLFHTKHDYDLYTVPQKHCYNQPKYWPRGKMLGGCSSLNAMMFHYGAPSDYDEWVDPAVPDSSSWSYANVKPYFRKFEKFTPSKVFPDVDVQARGSVGPIEVGYFGHYSEVARRFVDACEAIGIPKNPDVNTDKGTLGATKVVTYTDSRGRRVTTESAYLTPQVLARPNLTVAIGARVTRVLFSRADEGKEGPRANGVEFTNKPHGPLFQARARKEVILSAGAVHSPQILLLSGIGPAAQLASHGIPVVLDAPNVGQHLLDHIVVNVRFRESRSSPAPPSSLLYLKKPATFSEVARTAKAMWQFRWRGTGPLTSNVAEAAAFLRSDDARVEGLVEKDEKAEVEDATSAKDAPDLELIASPMAWIAHGHGEVPKGNLVSFGAVLLRPTSHGSIALRSRNPFDAPTIDPNYLATDHDVAVLVRGTRALLRAAASAPLAPLLDTDEADPFLDNHLLFPKQGPKEISGEALERLVRERTETLYHPASTCRMARREKGGVVDYGLRVYGVRGLRVADASVFTNLVAGHTAAPAIMIGEKLADELKKEWSA